MTRRFVIPYMSDLPLRLFTPLLEYVPGLSNYLFWNMGFGSLRNRSFTDDVTMMPLPLPKEVFGVENSVIIDGLEVIDQKNQEHNPASAPANHRFLRVYDYIEAYSTNRITPLQVCEKLIDKINQSCSEACDPPLYGMYQYNREDIMAQAEASTSRYNQNQTLGPLDGVPVAIKDEIDVIGYETRVGTTFLNRRNPASKDAFLVKKLREQGAIIIGKTNMHEISNGITTNNPSTYTSRNPYNTDHYCGGSSGGSAIPSSFCGIYGLKPTCGRISLTGDSVTGPMAACVDDLALAYYVMAGKDPEDPKTLYQPSPTLHGLYLTETLSDLKIGIFTAWNRRVVDSTITSALDTFINEFKLRGAEFIEIDIPELEDAQSAHAITAVSEYYSSMNEYKKYLHLLSLPNRASLAIYSNANVSDYIKAQQIRTRMMRNMSVLFSDVNLILTPTCAITAPPIYPRALKYGEIDYLVFAYAVRFTRLANFIGIPAVTVPVGYNDKNLPIGLQFMAKWYDEATLLRVAKVSEEILGNKRRRPDEKYWFGDLF
ncbi:12842_t:CDS:2 [Gigaspora margarita]|uniref:12842_t:CDS:1 n=1 Tax=Gigaspora margarita TaxID=4874 RepID=A0ABN7V3B9_GIGMA|nr:12842_t:CDS:2 [Gigaspora margarita]